ncbi:MAG: hypothetical protein ABFD16_09740 [Thermoguttaceae bacterium]
MSRRYFRVVLVPIAMLCMIAVGIASRLSAQGFGPADPNQGTTATEAPDQQGVETLTRGPMHEAFAEVVSYNPQPGVSVSSQPPDPIDEVPPDQKPEDENAIWIPGYWGWDQDRNDFIWVSGVWRVPPPNCQWVPGYWTQSDNGYQWVSGFWWTGEQGQQTEQVSYLPTPPESMESGPSSPQPADDQFWVPGCWIWQDVKYVWRAGYWAPIQPDWVWIPARYIWSPSGCVFLEGHWDYTLARRGLCFAPAYFQPAVYTQPAFQYIPTVVVNVQAIQYNLFCWPRYNHYYFGDYYGPQYTQVGIVPWFDLYHSRVGYEPFYVYDRWYYTHRKHERDWSKRIHESYEYRVKNEHARPPRTYAEMRRQFRGPEDRQRESLAVAVSLDRVARQKDFPVRLAPVNQQYRERMGSLRKDLRDFSKQRDQREAELRGKHPGKLDRPQQLRLSTSPISPERLQAAERVRQTEPGRAKPPTGPEKPTISEKPSPKPGPEGREREGREREGREREGREREGREREGREREGREREGREREGREGRPTPGKPEQPQGVERPRGPRGPEAPPTPGGRGQQEERGRRQQEPGGPKQFEQPGGRGPQPQGPGQQEQRGRRQQEPGGSRQFEQPGGRGPQPQGPGQQEQRGRRQQEPGGSRQFEQPGGRGPQPQGPGQQEQRGRQQQEPGGSRQFEQPGGRAPQGPGQQEQRGGRGQQPGFGGQRDEDRGPGQQQRGFRPPDRSQGGDQPRSFERSRTPDRPESRGGGRDIQRGGPDSRGGDRQSGSRRGRDGE